MRSTWKVVLLAPLGAVLFGVVGCNSLLQAVGLRSAESTATENDGTSGEQIGTQSLNKSGDSNILRNREAGIELTLPASWSEDTNLHESAELQALDPDKQLYIIVVAEEDDSLIRLGLRENAENYRNLLINRLQSNGQFENQSPTDVSFIGDDFANQYEIRGRVGDDTPVVYLHTTVVTENRYYQIVAWTTQAQYDAYKSELESITETFREVNAG